MELYYQWWMNISPWRDNKNKNNIITKSDVKDGLNHYYYYYFSDGGGGVIMMEHAHRTCCTSSWMDGYGSGFIMRCRYDGNTHAIIAKSTFLHSSLPPTILFCPGLECLAFYRGKSGTLAGAIVITCPYGIIYIKGE